MSQDASQTVPATRSGTGLFVSGNVLGIALGIAAGHLLLFSRSGPPDSTATAEAEFARLVAAAPRFAAVETPLTDDAASRSILEFDGQEDVGRVRLSDQSDDEDYLHFFPEAMHAPVTQRSAAAAAEGAPPGKSLASGPLQMTADTSHAGDPPPQALQPPLAAAPIDKATSDREELARSIIREELPEATAQEHDVWHDVLQGLPAEDIRGILRMRKHLGPGEALELSPLLSLPAPLSGVPEETGDSGAPPQAFSRASGAAGRLQQIARHNLANRYTAAYKQQIPVLVEAPADDPAGIDLTRVIRDMRQGELVATGRPLDIAIEGPGFLQVRRGDDVRYTRDGRLTLDGQRRLKLLAPADDWLVDPPIAITTGAIGVTISEQGRVTAILPDGAESVAGTFGIVQFLDPSALATEQEGLYEPSSASGAPHEVTAAQRDSILILQGHVERSNVIAPPAQECAEDDAAVGD